MLYLINMLVIVRRRKFKQHIEGLTKVFLKLNIYACYCGNLRATFT